jgi:hypothetical protein
MFLLFATAVSLFTLALYQDWAPQLRGSLYLYAAAAIGVFGVAWVWRSVGLEKNKNSHDSHGQT